MLIRFDRTIAWLGWLIVKGTERVTIHRFPQLAHWGAFTAVVENGRLLKCEPFEHDRAPSRMLESVVPMVYSEKRIKRPAVRRSWLEKREASDGRLRGREDFVEVDWDTALDLVASEAGRVRAQYGAEGIFGGSYGWSSAGRLHHARSLIRRFYFTGGGCVDQQGNYSWGAGQYILPHVIGTYSPLTGRGTSWPSILRNAKVLLAFGGLSPKNGQVGSGGAGEHTQEGWLRKLGESGIRVINVSPIETDCPEFLDAHWISIRPTTDVALMLALAFEIDRLGQADHSFLETHCVGYEALRAYFRGESDGVAKSPEWASEITGVPARDIAWLARQLCGQRSFITCAFSVQRAHRGEQPYWMAIALSAMLGQVGLPGGGFGFGHGSMNGVGNPRLPTPGPEMVVGRNPAQIAIPVARITDMLLGPGKPYRFNGGEYTYPEIRMIHWAGGNPFHHHQQLNRLVDAWSRPQTIVVNEIFWTPAARRADIVLPVTTSLERNDIGGSSRDRYVLAMHKAIAPLHSARSDLEIFTELSQRLGYEAAYTENRDEMAWIRDIYERCAVHQQQAGAHVPSFEEFWRTGYIALPPPSRDSILFEEFRTDPVANPLGTPSGKIELFSERIASFGLDDIGGHPRWSEPVEWLGTKSSDYPLHLLTVQPVDRLHSQLDYAPLAQSNKTAGAETLLIHPEDAAQRSIEDGDAIVIFNDRGRCLAGARLWPALRPGVVIASTGAWYDPDPDRAEIDRAGAMNVLTLDMGTSELTQGPNAMSCLVDVAVAAGSATGTRHRRSDQQFETGGNS
ncbi:MAG TPA: molybdopterin-dependent oxidoreductase [Burkholderiaceae bacterium]|nr:molybdopterin-dependent oxidoreductase [Burkholderiaceae bacterium]